MSEQNISEARLEANRQNAQLSTGPVTSEGKAKVRFNAVKNNLTGQHVVVREEEGVAYRTHIQNYALQFDPVGPEECALVQSIADIRWRLNRIPGLESALLAKGQTALAEERPHFLTIEQLPALEVDVRQRYEKDFRNLALQENRLTRRREREMAELLRLQAERKSREKESLAEAAKAVLLAEHRKQDGVRLARLGFDFSKESLDTYYLRLTPAARQKLLAEALLEAGESEKIAEAAA